MVRKCLVMRRGGAHGARGPSRELRSRARAKHLQLCAARDLRRSARMRTARSVDALEENSQSTRAFSRGRWRITHLRQFVRRQRIEIGSFLLNSLIEFSPIASEAVVVVFSTRPDIKTTDRPAERAMLRNGSASYARTVRHDLPVETERIVSPFVCRAQCQVLINPATGPHPLVRLFIEAEAPTSKCLTVYPGTARYVKAQSFFPAATSARVWCTSGVSSRAVGAGRSNEQISCPSARAFSRARSRRAAVNLPHNAASQRFVAFRLTESKAPLKPKLQYSILSILLQCVPQSQSGIGKDRLPRSDDALH